MYLYDKGMPFVISSPSGAGKTSVAELLVERNENIRRSISITTRAARNKEMHGVDYVFISEDEFHEQCKNGTMLEYAKVFENYYGTSKNQVKSLMNKGYDVLCVIDWQGTLQLMKKMTVVSIFLLPPTMQELRDRLISRNQDSKKTISYRMDNAKNEILHYDHYDYVVVNEDLEQAYDAVYNIICSERRKRVNQNLLSGFIDKLMLEKV